MTTDLRQRLDQQIALLSAQGWEVVNRTDTAAQLRRKRRISPLGIPVLVLTPFLLGFFYQPLFLVAIVGLLIILVGQSTAKTELKYITEKDLL